MYKSKPRSSKEISRSIIRGLKQSLAFSKGESKPGIKKRFKKIPKFKNEDEEREFWHEHDSTDYIDWSKAKRVSFPNLKPTNPKKFLKK